MRTLAHLFDPFGLRLIRRVFIALVVLVAVLGVYRAVHHAPFALIGG